MGIPGNTAKNAFGISKYVFSQQKHELSEKIGWEYLGILEEMPLGYQNMYFLNKNMSKQKK